MWIDSGAPFEGYMKISDNSFSKEILNYLPPINTYVDPPSKKNLVNLLENDFRIEKVSAESNFIDVKYLGSSFSSKKLNLLLKVSENIQRLDLSNIDLIFADPPFNQNIEKKILEIFHKNENLKLSCKIYIEFNKFTKIDLPNSFKIIKDKMIGDVRALLISKK